jgi:signal transduction histidine kinase
LRIEDDSRRLLARNLHDTTAQHLAALSMNLSVLNEEAVGGGPRAERALAESIALVDTCLREVRTMAHLLHPPELDELGLPSALARYTDGFSERSGIRVQLRARDGFGRLPQPVETAIFRIVQEGLTNIHRHSGSATAEIDLERVDGSLRLIVRDAGRGLRGRGAGIGVTSMRERVNELGGQMSLTSDPDGTTLAVTIPYEEDAS